MKKIGLLLVAVSLMFFNQAVFGEKIEKSFDLEKGKDVSLHFSRHRRQCIRGKS